MIQGVPKTYEQLFIEAEFDEDIQPLLRTLQSLVTEFRNVQRQGVQKPFNFETVADFEFELKEFYFAFTNSIRIATSQSDLQEQVIYFSKCLAELAYYSEVYREFQDPTIDPTLTRLSLEEKQAVRNMVNHASKYIDKLRCFLQHIKSSLNLVTPSANSEQAADFSKSTPQNPIAFFEQLIIANGLESLKQQFIAPSYENDEKDIIYNQQTEELIIREFDIEDNTSTERRISFSSNLSKKIRMEYTTSLKLIRHSIQSLPSLAEVHKYLVLLTNNIDRLFTILPEKVEANKVGIISQVFNKILKYITKNFPYFFNEELTDITKNLLARIPVISPDFSGADLTLLKITSEQFVEMAKIHLRDYITEETIPHLKYLFEEQEPDLPTDVIVWKRIYNNKPYIKALLYLFTCLQKEGFVQYEEDYLPDILHQRFVGLQYQTLDNLAKVQKKKDPPPKNVSFTSFINALKSVTI